MGLSFQYFGAKFSIDFLILIVLLIFLSHRYLG